MRKKILYIGLLLPAIICCDDAPLVQHTENEHSESDTEMRDSHHEHTIIDEQDEDDGEEDNDEALDVDRDAFDLPEYARGNWYKKQEIVKKAHDDYQDVRREEHVVAQFEKVFIDKKNILTNMLEVFSQSLGVPFVHVYTLISDEIEAIERGNVPQSSQVKDSSDHAVLSPEERIKAAQKQEVKSVLLHLKKDIDVITDLYKALDQAMVVLMQQITASHHFEQKAFDSYEKITHVLSDQVAKQLYAEIRAAHENIVNIAEYIKGDFSRYFEELSQNCIKSLEIIQQQLNSLKEHGVDLLLLQAEAHKDAEIKKTASELDDKASKSTDQNPEKSYYHSFKNFFVNIGSFFNAIITWFRGFFV